MSKLYQGKFVPKKPSKYEGNPTNIIYRSAWELSVMFWCDSNDTVVKWSSETVVVPYLCPTDGRPHRYFVDFKMTFASGETQLVEIKPSKQTGLPKGKIKSKRYISEMMTYIKNEAKWKHAEAYAKQQGWTFKVWTEDTLNHLGIKILSKL